MSIISKLCEDIGKETDRPLIYLIFNGELSTFLLGQKPPPS